MHSLLNIILFCVFLKGDSVLSFKHFITPPTFNYSESNITFFNREDIKMRIGSHIVKIILPDINHGNDIGVLFQQF